MVQARPVEMALPPSLVVVQARTRGVIHGVFLVVVQARSLGPTLGVSLTVSLERTGAPRPSDPDETVLQRAETSHESLRNLGHQVLRQP